MNEPPFWEALFVLVQPMVHSADGCGSQTCPFRDNPLINRRYFHRPKTGPMRSLFTLTLLFPLLAQSQTLVSTLPQPRTALLEEFTAINCGNCPAAHATATSLFAQYGAQLVGVEVHGGSLANPSGSQPDFRTTDGAALWSQFDVNFQPQGKVNRQALSSASGWNAAIGNIISQDSPANIGIGSSVTGSTLNVTVEVYYTGISPSTDDEIHVALTEDHILGYQQDYGNGAQQNYDHRNALRDMITPVAGDPVAVNVMGTLVERTYTLELDPSWNLADLHVVAFVGPASGAVYQVRQVDADGGITTAINESRSILDLGNIYPMPATDQVFITVDPATAGNTLVLRDALGRMVTQERIGTGAINVVLSVADLKSGVYFASFAGGEARKIIVAR